jgi:hypothetical protein
MGTANRDASQVTVKNRNKALSSYKDQWKAETMTTASPKPGITGPATTSAEVVAQIRLGCEACTVYTNSLTTPNIDPNTVVYPFNPSSGGAGRNY